MLLVLVACSSPANKPDASDDGGGTDGPLDPGERSGTRLKLRYYDFGTVRELLGIHDSLRDETCAAAEFADGMTYCMPIDTKQLVYADTACTQPIGLTAESGTCASPPPAYFAEHDPWSCVTTMTRLFRRGAVITRSEHFTKGPSGSCNAGGASSSDVYYALTEVPLTELAALSVSEPFMTGRLGTRYHESVDGMRFPLTAELHDAVLGARCIPWSYLTDATIGTCVPRDVAFVSGFSDATCTQRHATTTAGCSAPTAAVSYEACQTNPAHYFPLAAKLTPTSIYSGSSGMCVGSAPSAGSDYYGVGAELVLASMAREIGTGSERLQPVHFTTPEGLRTRDRGLFDSRLGVMCHPNAQANGGVLCVPNGTEWQTMYTDADCTNAVELIRQLRQSTCAVAPAPLYAARLEQSAACRYNNVVRRVGAPYVGAVYRRFGTTCTPYTSADHVLYRLADAVPASDLAAGTLVTE